MIGPLIVSCRIEIGERRLLTGWRVRDPMEFHCDCHSSSCHSSDCERVRRGREWLVGSGKYELRMKNKRLDALDVVELAHLQGT